MRKLDAVLASFVEDKKAVGVSALITKHGKEAYFGCAGMANAGQGIPMARETPLRVYSMTKPVTATAALMLIERGALRLDMPLSELLPEYKHMQVCEEIDGKLELVPAKREITVFDLLTMTSGIVYGDDNEHGPATSFVNARVGEFFLKMREVEKAGTPVELVSFSRHLASCPLAFHPGEQWRYGMSCDVLGAMVIAASGKSLNDFFSENIFKPLGMNETCLSNLSIVNDDLSSRLAKTYIPTAKGFAEKKRGLLVEMLPHPYLESAGAGLISTLDDFAIFGNMLLNGGEYNGARILKAETVKQMRTNQLSDKQLKTYDGPKEKGYGYGFSVRVMMDPQAADYDESVGAFGWNGAAGTSLRIDTDRGTVLVFGCQRMPANHELFLPELSQAAGEL